MVDWRIYYGDGSTFDSSQGSPLHAPALNVQCIVQPDPDVGRHVVSKFAYYWWDGEWYGGDLFGLHDYLMRPGPKTVKFGRTVSNAEYRAVVRRAAADPDFTPGAPQRDLPGKHLPPITGRVEIREKPDTVGKRK